MAAPFPASVIRLWYGFIVGNRGGSGSLHMEDRESYEARMTAFMVPYEVTLVHELSHTYISHESLDQFLELYVYNMIHTNSQNVQEWVFKRDYVASRASNEGIHALLDVYQLIGPEAMANAYRAVYPLRPPYGPLSNECKQVFIDQAPSALKGRVSDKMAKVTN